MSGRNEEEDWGGKKALIAPLAKPSPVFPALVHGIRPLPPIPEQREVLPREIADGALGYTQAHHLAVTQLAVVRDALEIVVAHPSLGVGPRPAGVARPAGELVGSAAEDGPLGVCHLVLDVPEASGAEVDLLTILLGGEGAAGIDDGEEEDRRRQCRRLGQERASLGVGDDDAGGGGCGLTVDIDSGRL